MLSPVCLTPIHPPIRLTCLSVSHVGLTFTCLSLSLSDSPFCISPCVNHLCIFLPVRPTHLCVCLPVRLSACASQVCGCDEYLLEKYPLSQYKVNHPGLVSPPTCLHTLRRLTSACLPAVHSFVHHGGPSSSPDAGLQGQSLLPAAGLWLRHTFVQVRLIHRRRECQVRQNLDFNSVWVVGFSRRTPQPSPCPGGGDGSPPRSLWAFNTLLRVRLLCATYVNVNIRDIDKVCSWSGSW